MKENLALLKNKSFMKLFLSLAVPLALQQLLVLSVGLMDSIMVGSLGEVELSAVTLGNQPALLLTFFVFGIGSGAGVLIAQYWGKGDTVTISKITAIAIRFALIISVFFAAFVLIMPEFTMSIFTDHRQTIEVGVSYLEIVGWSYVFYAITNAYISCVRSVERVKIAVALYSVSFCVNVFFNYIFIFGKLGAPQLGAAGAAVGTLIARTAEIIILIIYNRKETRIRLKAKYFIKSDKILRHDFVKYGAPVIFNETTWSLGLMVQTAVLGRLGVAAVASISIINTVQQILMVMIYGTASAALVIIGKKIGQKRYDEAKQSAFSLLFLTVMLGVLAGGLLILLKNAYLSLYSISAETYSLISVLIIIAAVVLVFQSINIISVVGIFRGGGDTKFGMMLDLIFMWCLAVPLGLIAGLWIGAAVPIVFMCIRCDEVCKAFFSIRRVKSLKWLKNVTRDDLPKDA